MRIQDSASLRRLLAFAVLAAAMGLWSGCPGDGGGNGDGGEDSGQDAGSGSDGGGDGGSGSDGGSDAGGGDAGVDAGPVEPSLTALNQTLTLSTDLTIASATATAPGWVVVDAGLPDGGAANGFTAVPAGTSANVHVAVGDPLATGTAVGVELRRDLGAIGTYEPTIDVLVTADGGVPVTGSFQVTVPAGTPAVRYTFSPTFTSTFVWRVSAFPARFSSTLSGSDNPGLTLYRGWRYEAQDSLFLNHPWQLINTTGADSVLLSQGAPGSMEGDPSIGWVNANGVSRFTLSPSLEASLTFYRCGVHTTLMRAPITIQSR